MVTYKKVIKGLHVIAAIFIALVTSPLVLAGSSGAIDPFPISGAVTALQREDRDHVSIIEFAGNYDKNLGTSALNVEPRAVIAREFYRTHPDNYDFLVVFSTFEFNTPDALAFHWGVQNKVQGIGLKQYDNTQLFGSHGKLQGYIDMAALTRYATEPTDPKFDFTLGVLAHEMLHQWAAFVKFKQPDGSFSDALLGRDGAHWSYLLDDDGSVEYGADWKDNGNGTFTSLTTRKFFSSLDLYLAGFYKPQEVAPFFLINNPQVDKTKLPDTNVTISGTKQVVSIDDVIAAEGPRNPSADQAQKNFRMAFILVTGQNETVSTAQLQAINNVRNAFMSRFSILTGGRAVVEVYPEAMPTTEQGVPTTVTGDAIRTTPANLEDGFAWLRGRQQQAGYWSDKDATTVRDTTAATSALASLDSSFTGAGVALQWLKDNPSGNTDYLARQSRLIAELNGDSTAIRSQLMTLQNADGGWGVTRGYQSDPLDTALAVLALSGGSGNQTAISNAAQYLLSNQNADGGWPGAIGSPSRTTVTATVLRALQSIGRQASVTTNALAWLSTKQNSDGGFGDSPSTVHDTANVVQTFIAFSAVTQIRSVDATNFILSRQTTSGGWEGSVYATASALSALKRFSSPNFVVDSISASPIGPRDGDRVQFRVIVRNDGNQASQSSVLRIYDGDPAAGGHAAIADSVIPPMASGSSLTFSPLWDSLNHAGTHTFFAVADPDNAQTETSKRDNRASVGLVVQAAPGGIDLAFGAPDISVSPTQPNRLPTLLAITVTVRNLGLTDAHNVPVTVWAGSPGTGTLIGTSTVDVLARSSVPVNFSYSLTKPGSTSFTVQIDPDHTTADDNVANNTASVAIATSPSIDLVVTPADITVDKNPALTGDDVTFKVKLTNEGTTDSPSTQVAYVVTDGNTTHQIRTNSIQLNAGSSTEQSITWRVDLSGNLTFTTQLDPAGLVPELDESNNIATHALSAGNPSGPNLAVSYVDLTANPNPGREGYPLVLTATVRNTGTTVANNAEVAFYSGDPSAGGIKIGTTQVIAALAPGASTPVSITWTAIPDSADKLIYVVADPANKIAEFSETDNSAFNVVPVLSLPDLAVSSGDVQLSPANPRTNEAVMIAVKVSNLGAQNVTNVLVRAFDGDPTAGGIQIGGDQIIANLNGLGSAVVNFNWTTAATSSHSLYVQADPLNAVLERTKTNNIARRDVAVQNGNYYVTNKYFSPDGDGKKDTTQFLFRLQSADTVTVNVLNKKGAVVRHFANAAWTNITSGDVTWDGLNDFGSLVQDGTYRLRLLDSNGATLGEVGVEVDTNRSSLLKALGTSYASYSNLTCELPNIEDAGVNGGLQFTNDDDLAFFNISSGRSPQAAYPLGVYRMASDGTDIRAILSESTFNLQNDYPFAKPVVSADGSKLAFFRSNTTTGVNWTVDADGKNPKQLTQSSSQYGVWLSPDGKTAYQLTERYLSAVNSDNTGSSRTIYRIGSDPHTEHDLSTIITDDGSYVVSADGRKLAFVEVVYATGNYAVHIVDLPTGTDVVLNREWVNYQPLLAWSPNAARLAIVDIDALQIGIFGADGTLQRTVASPIVPGANDGVDLRNLSWSSTNTELGFTVRHFSLGNGGGYGGGYGGGSSSSASSSSGSGALETGGIYVADLITGVVSKTADFLDDNGCGEGCGSYHISTWDGAKWVDRGVLHYGLRYSEQTLDLQKFLPDADGQYRVRIRQIGHEAAHIERVALLSGGAQLQPNYAVLLASSQDILDKVIAHDNVVADVYGKEIEVRWPNTLPKIGNLKLALYAHEETLSNKHVVPFSYPADATHSYQYLISGNRPLLIDGQQTSQDNLLAPLFKTFTAPDTGHPSADVYGYVQSDSQYLYGTLDFTVDNTEDGGSDWASIRLRTASGWKEFKVTTADKRYGTVGFIQTGMVSYPHKYYEFKIPLSEIGASVGSVVDVTFKAYGSAAIVLDEPQGLVSGGKLFWVPGERSLLYYKQYSGTPPTAIFLDDNNQQEQAFIDWTQIDLRELHFSPTGRQLLFNSNKQARDPSSTCYRQGYDDEWSYKSLLNLTADLRAVRSAKAGGIQLKGTASDLNFSNYVLAYAPVATPNAWQQIAPASGEPVVDDLFTTWVPPAPGNYFVRLTVEDLAGNTRQAIRRVSWSDTPSITDVNLTPAIISPNGDGINDAATIHYRVLEPVHLSFQFYNTSGQLVRTITRDHSAAGIDVNLEWDGRDDRGLPVADGKYRMTVQNYEFFVTVDATPPVALIDVRQAYQRLIQRTSPYDSVYIEPGMEWDASDLHLSTTTLEVGEGDNPTTWDEFTPSACLPASPPANPNDPIPLIGTPHTYPDRTCSTRDVPDFVNRQFRLTAIDTAGNKTVAISSRGDQQLIITEYGNHTKVDSGCPLTTQTSAPCASPFKRLTTLPYVPMSDQSGGSRFIQASISAARFTVVETIRKPVVQLAVQYRLATKTTWSEANLKDFYSRVSTNILPDGTPVEDLSSIPAIQDNVLRASWDMAGLQPSETYVLRLHAIDADGNDYYSNTFQTKSEGLILKGKYDPPNNPTLNVPQVDELIANNPPSDNETVVWGQNLLGTPLPSVKLFLQSDKDPRYAKARQMGELAYPQEYFIYKLADLKPCTDYTGYLEATTEATADPSTGQIVTRTIRTGNASIRVACMELKVTAKPVAAQSCDAVPPQQLSINIVPKSLSNTQLKLLTLSQPLPNSTIDNIVFNVNKPASDAPYAYLMDISQLGEGQRTLTAKLIDVEDNSTQQQINVVIDHTPPTSRITYPLEGQQLCGVPTMINGELHRSVTLQGEITDAGGFDYKVETGVGDTTIGFEPKSQVHDSETKDSFFYPPKSTANTPLRNHDVSGPIARLVDEAANGAVTVRLNVRDWGGYQRCELRTFSVDSVVEGAHAAINYALFSPNGDDAFDEVEITYGVDEAATFNANVYHAVLQPNGQLSLQGSSVRALAQNVAILAGDSSLSWDGRDSGGAVLSDGLYVIVLDFKDACGNPKTLTLATTIDNTPPDVTIAYPHTADQLPMLVEIQGAVTDPHIRGYAVEWGLGSFPDNWVRLNAKTGNTAGTEILGKWNTYGLDGGAYAIRVVATDTVGNERIVQVPLSVQTRLNLIGYFEANPDLFSPNGDGKLESTSLRYELEQAGIVTLTITDSSGAIVKRKLITNSSMGQGPVAITWDGRDDQGNVLPDGTYTADLLVAAASNPLIRQEEKTTMTIDATAPLIEVTRPVNGFVPATGAVIGSINDLRLSEYTVSLTDKPLAPVWTAVDSGNINRTKAALGSLQDLPEGDYALKVEAADQADNQRSQVIPFTIDNTPPKVALTAPDQGVVVGVKKGLINISGSVDELHLQSYRLRVGAGGAPNTWSDIAIGNTLPLPTVIKAWDVSSLADGIYTLSLLAEDKAGLTGEARRTLVVDNTAPTATITTPTELAYIKRPSDILGSANDDNFSNYKLEVAPGVKASATRWSEIGTGTTAVATGTLLSWQALPPDGVQTLRLTVKDKADNVSTALVQVTVDTTPPAAPINLAATVENVHDIRLTWTPNSETDLAGYAVYRNGVRITASLLSNPTYLDQGLPDGRYVYVVKAFDKAEWESAPSNEVSKAIDITAPTARISSPVTGTIVSGLLDIKGTAFSADDFKEYRLLVGSGSGYQLLRRSPVPLVSDVLTQWNTTVLTEGATYTLKLEAEDINGNVATDSVTVTVDNSPPAAPTGLKAVATGSNVQLTWNANSEPDLLGYLVFRNEHLANQQGVLVGSLRPYAVTGVAYLDVSLADGPYTYYLLAIDKAGNTSDPSNTAQVALDTHPPHATIAQPSVGISFDKPQYVLATSADTDIARVQFQYRAVSSGTWINLGIADTSLPYEASFDPKALNLPQGNYQLQAVATDLGNKTDASPTPITVTYKDVTPPTVAAGLNSKVNGGDVTLTWTANTDSDLAGYYIDRTGALGSTVRLTAAPVTPTTYVDHNLSDDTYRYQIIAVDTGGNAAAASAASWAIVYTPFLKQPYTPTTQGALTISGSGQSGSTVSAQLVTSSTTVTLPPVNTDAAGLFTIPGAVASPGVNTITLSLTDGVGNVSKSVSAEVVVGMLPSVPTGLSATANGYQVTLSWNANPESNILGYRILRNSQSLLPDLPMTDLTATASSTTFTSSGYYDAVKAVDNNPATYWLQEGSSVNQWLMVNWPEQRDVTHVDLIWEGAFTAPADFDVEVWSGKAWVTAAEVRDNNGFFNNGVNAIYLAQPYRTNQLRIVTLKSTGFGFSFALREIGVFYRQLVATRSFTDTASDGVQHYSVGAVNSFGFESAPTDPVQLPVGDVTAPDPVALAASVLKNDVTLTWSASASNDVALYTVYRYGALIATISDVNQRIYTDYGLANGDYIDAYTVKAVDHVNNESVPSNAVSVSIAIPVPPALTTLGVTVVPTGGALDLSWTPQAGFTPARYVVMRSTDPVSSDNRNFDTVAEITDTRYRDSGLSNGTTYFYIVRAVDRFGNMSGDSNEASGTPQDQIAPSVAIHSPTLPGRLYRTLQSALKVVARTEPAATVVVSNNGAKVGQAQARATSELLSTNTEVYWDAILSPDGHFAVYQSYNSEIKIHDFSARSDTVVVNLASGDDAYPAWSSDGAEIVFVDLDSATNNHYVRAYSVTSRTIRSVTTPSSDGDLPFGSLSPDKKRLFVSDYGNNQWLIDLSSGTRLALAPDSIDLHTVSWSFDSSRFAYLRTSPGLAVVLVHAATSSSTVLAEDDVQWEVPQWSPDGSAVLYGKLSALGHQQIYRYGLNDATTVELTQGDDDKYCPVWSPDGRAIAYQQSNDSLPRLQELTTGAISTLEQSSLCPAQWTASGHLLTWGDYGYFGRLEPAGRVEFGLSLVTGDNVVTMQATDASGNKGASSDAIVLTRNSVVQLPDLTVGDSDLRILPAAPKVGEHTRVSVTVHNIGTVSSTAATITLLAVDSNGSTITLVDGTALGAIAAGQVQTLSYDWTPNTAGAYQLVAIVDSSNLIVEVSKTNNLAIRDFQVIGSDGQRLAVATTESSYTPGAQVSGTATVTNYDETFNGRLTVIIEDQQSYLVQSVYAGDVTELAYNSAFVSDVLWSTGRTFAGNYQVHARLFDANNQLIAQALAPFAIDSNSNLSSDVTTDKAVYLANSNVRVNASYTYTTGNVVISGAEAALKILDAANQVLAEIHQPLGDLLPGVNGAVTYDWNTATNPVGTYHTSFSVTQSGETLTSKQSSLQIAAGSVSVSGTLALSDQAPAPGTPQLATYSIKNLGNAAYDQLPVLISLLDPTSLAPIETHRVLIDLGVDGQTSSTTVFDTTALTLKTYTVLLQAELVESGSTNLKTLASTSFNVPDRSPPTVNVRTPAAGGIIRGSSTVVVFARDLLSAVSSVDLNIDDQGWNTLTVSDASQNLYSQLLQGLSEGIHSVAARATDTWNNTTAAVSRSFIVDNTPPTINVAGVVNGGDYNVVVTPQITIVDANLDKSSLFLNGTAYVSGAPIASNGSYQLVVNAVDKAGNSSVKSLQFAVDTIGPQIVITGVQEGGLYNTDVIPVIQITDTQPVTSVIALNGNTYSSGTVITAESTYELKVVAKDNANNSTTAVVHFTVDKTAPTITFVSPTDGATLNTHATNVTGTTEPQALVMLSVGTFQVSVTADAQGRFSATQVPLADGLNRISAYGRDRAGNTGVTASLNVRVSTATPPTLDSHVASASGVLVWLPGTSKTRDCREEGSHGQRSPKSTPQVASDHYASLSAMIESTLLSSDTDYLIVRNETSFIQALRGHRYGTVLFAELQSSGSGDPHGDNGEDDSGLKMSDATADELQASVAAGTGVVWIKTHPDDNEHLQALFGAKPNGALSNLSQVALPNSVASVAGTWNTQGFGMKVKLLNGTRVGDLKPGLFPAMVISQYGNGRTVLMAFDPSAFVDSQGGIGVLTNALNYAAISGGELLPGSVAEVDWTAVHLSAPIDLQLKVHLPDAVSFVNVSDDAIVTNHDAVWIRRESTDHSVFSALVRLPQSIGSYGINAQLYQNQSGSLTRLAENALTVSVIRSRDALGASALDIVRNLKVSKSQQINQKKAVDAVQAAISRAQRNQADAAYSINSLLTATNQLLAINSVPNDAVVAVAQLLSAYEALWAGYP